MAATLTVPAARGTPPKDLEIRPKQVKAWAEALPLARSVEAGRRIHDHLAALNQSRVDSDDRIEILQNYRPVVAVVFDELEAIYAKSVIPMPAKSREALALARDLSAQLAAGYVVAASDIASRRIAFGAKKQVPLLLLRAVEQHAAALRASYKSYTPVNEGVWRALHELYLYADEEGFASDPADPETNASIADAYSEAVLLSLTDPYRLSPGELDRVIALIRSVKAPAPLTQSAPATTASAHFLVPCDTDKPPKPALSASDDRGGDNWRLLDANPLVEKLRARKAALDKGNVSAAMKQSMGADGALLLEKLIALWGDPPKRASPRDAMESTVAVCMGLKGVSHYLGLEPKPNPEEAEIIRRGITIPLAPLAPQDSSAAHPASEWEVVNQSAGGLKVKRTKPSPHTIAVGEIVGVKIAGRPRWTVGLVRWITVLEEGGLEFGVQFLANAARPASLRPTITSAGTEAKPAIILCEALPWQGGESLLAASGTFSDLREFEVTEAGECFNVRATTLHERTGRYEIFEFTAS